MGEVDPAFIQAVEHRPKLSINEAGGIPLVDLSPVNGHDSSEDLQAHAALVAEVGKSCEEWGFFQVINHGVPSQLLQRVEAGAKKFFALSSEEKRKVARDQMNPLGYYDTEHTKNVRDWKEVFDFTVEHPTVIPASHESDNHQLQSLFNQWPEYPPDLREACEEYARAVEKLSYTLLELISLSLGLPAKRLNGFFKDQTTFIRFNHYPLCPSPHLALGVGRHKDGGALTVLAQDDVGGLDVRRKADGEWIRVKPIPDSYIINVGDIVQVTVALAQAGLESSNLIVGIDFTKSNEWTGARSFNRRSLHHIGDSPNPYEQAISIIGRTLSAFDEDNLIPCFGVGDASTHDQEVFSFYPDDRPCNGFEDALNRYKEIVPQLRLTGPKFFAPIIETAIGIVDKSGGQYHVLLIIADGQVTRSVDTKYGRLSPQEQDN